MNRIFRPRYLFDAVLLTLLVSIPIGQLLAEVPFVPRQQHAVLHSRDAYSTVLSGVRWGFHENAAMQDGSRIPASLGERALEQLAPRDRTSE